MDYQEAFHALAEAFVSKGWSYDFLVRELARVLEVEVTFVGEVTGEPAEILRTVAVAGKTGKRENFRFDLAGTPCAEAIANGPLFLAEGAGQRYPTLAERWGIEAEAWAGVPLTGSTGLTVGVLGILHSESLAEREETVLPLLHALAARVAAKIECRRLQHTVESRTRLLHAIQEAQQFYLSSEQPEETFMNLAELLAETTESPYAMIAELRPHDDATYGIRVLGFSGLPEELVSMVLDETAGESFAVRNPDGLFARVIRTGRAVISDRFSSPVPRAGTGHLPPHHPQLTTFLGLPLMANKEVVGIAGVADRPGGYDEEMARFLQPLAGACGALIQAMRRSRAVEAARRSLRAKERFLTNVVESLAHPFYVVDTRDYTVTLANEASRQEHVTTGMKCYQLTHGREEPCDGADHPCPLAIVKETGKAAVFTHRHQSRDGRERIYEIHAYPLRNEQGEVSQMIEYTLDITDRLRAEEALRRRNRELRLLNWVMASAVAGVGPEQLLETACVELGRTLEIPFAAGAMVEPGSGTARIVTDPFAKNRPSLFGRTALDLSEESAIGQLLQHGQPMVTPNLTADPRVEGLASLLRPTGVVSAIFAPLLAEGTLEGLIVLGSDEPNRFSDDDLFLVLSVASQLSSALAKATLNATRKLLQTAVEHLPDSVVITDPNGTITYVNPAFETITGYSRDEATGRTPRILKSGRHPAEFYRSLWDRIISGQVWQGRIVNRRKDGTLFTEDAVISPVRNDEGEIIGFIKVGRDVTEQLKLEEQVRQAQRMERLARMARGIAHDFNNVLGAIIGYAELGLAQTSEHEPVHETLHELLEAASSGADLTEQLLTFARGQTVERHPLDLAAIVRGKEGLIRRLLGPDLELVLRIDLDPAMVIGDRSELEQILLNLVVNARDAMPHGGKLTLEVTGCPARLEQSLMSPEMETDPMVCLRISDTGVGIPDELREHLFEPFFTTKEHGKGTGLGLAICYGIVQQMGGRIEVESVLGEGSTFTVFLPAAEASAD